MTRLLLVALVGCGAPATPIANHAPRSIAAGCPYVGFQGTVWLHEVFPGCPSMPFGFDFPMCNGECPRPCRSRDGDEVTTYRYDATGNWLETRTATAADSCTYANGRIASCGDGYEHWLRRADGRIVAIVTGSKRETWMTARYDERGDAVELAFPGFATTHTFRYDGEHRLVEQTIAKDSHTDVFTYEHGRLVSRGDGELRSTYGYDERGRLVRVDNTQWPVGPAPRALVTLDYDGQGRVVRITEVWTDKRRPVMTTFEYCP